MDRGYNDYRLFERWSAEGVRLVTRMKTNAECDVREERLHPWPMGGEGGVEQASS